VAANLGSAARDGTEVDLWQQLGILDLPYPIWPGCGMIPPTAGSEDGADRQPKAIRRWDGSRRLWNLWDIMQLFKLSEFLFSYHTIVSTAAIIHNRPDTHGMSFENVETSQLFKDATSLLVDLDLFELEMSATTARHLLNHLLNRSPLSEIQRQIESLHGRIHDELTSRTLLLLSPRETALYGEAVPFGQDVSDKFPSAAYEVEEAMKCLALGRSTASAFHSIRCLELGIKAISRCLGIPDPTKAADRSWFKLLKAIKDETDKRWPTSTNKLSGDGRFFEEAYAALAAMQNPYRNATMHLDQKYTEAEAQHTFDIVKGFMVKLASRCDENGEPNA
jgi:hypothetical protein